MPAVIPKTDCPHVATAYKPENIPETIPLPGNCHVCNDASENWICLHCGKISCSRYVQGHAASHNAESDHAISVSFSDLSVWCYKCDSYIKDPVFADLLWKIHDVKFTEEVNEHNETEIPSSPPSSDAPVEQKSSEGESDEEDDSVQLLQQLMGGIKIEQKEPTKTILEDLTLEGVVKAIQSGKCKNIIVMTGAGISVAAGIPDFRTPGTGLYDNLQKYNLPHPTAVFEMDYFRNNPQPFYLLAKELYPGLYKPTPVHFFIKLLQQKGLLLRNFTQNIDTLERVAEIPGEYLVEAHGSFASARCIDCKTEEKIEVIKENVFKQTIPRCSKCNGIVKPDIVFFGESLPSRFFSLMEEDFPKCDLLIVIGTSLQVHPFASLTNRVTSSTPRLLINNEVVGKANPSLMMLGFDNGFRFGMPNNYRDIAVIGDCQDGVRKLTEMLGWKDELDALVKNFPKL